MRVRESRRWAALVLAAGVFLLGSSRAWSAPPVDKRELQAREAYAAGQYKEALDLYAKLYAEKLHPTFLRNIGRCYQLLGDPDRAINSFREYLHKAKGLKAAERAEVEGYIKEMEALKQRGPAPQPAAGATTFKTAPPATATTTTTTTTTPSGTGTAPAAPPAAAPPAETAAAGTGAASAPVLIAQPAATGKESQGESPAFYKRWWFWTAVGVVVVAGAVVVATGALNRSKDAACDTTRSCM